MKEHDIRPKALFDRYLELTRRDADALLADRARFAPCACPACGEDAAVPGLVKDGWSYSTCGSCASLYLNPRPSAARMAEFYASSESVKFWATEFYRQTVEARRERMFKPRAAAAAAVADSLGLPRGASLCDVGSGYGIFLEEARALGRFGEVFGVEPASALAAVCREKGFRVVEKTVEECGPGEAQADLAACFEVLEHVHDPAEFLRACRSILAPGGRLLATTLVCTGFDIATLWARSKSVHPPHHVNLMSVEGIRRLFARAGYEIERLETPGRLDVDIVRNALAEDPSLELPRFVRILLDAPEPARAAFQDFLAANLLSSHVRVAAKAV